MKKPLPLDYAIVGAVIALSLLSLLLFLKPGGQTVRVEQDGVLLYAGDIHTDHVVEADGNTVVIRNGRVTVVAADCPDGLCLHGEATAARPLVCLPNRLVATIASGEVAPDAVTY